MIKIMDLPEDLKALAIRNQKSEISSDWNRDVSSEVREAFNFYTAPEGFQFWVYVSSGNFDKARGILPNRHVEQKIVRRFPSGAVRSDDRGRIRPDYISPYALEEIAKHFTANEKEFGSDEDATNYFKGIKPVDVKSSIGRHYIELMQSFAESNEEGIRINLRAMAANCIMSLHQIVIEERGLYKEPYEKTEYIEKY